MNCIFCKIISGEIPSEKVYDDNNCYAFKDISPQAPVHILVVPKVHIESVQEVNADNSHFVSEIFEAIPKIANTLPLENGYRVISNCGSDACQTVPHLHFHILGGKKLAEEIG